MLLYLASCVDSIPYEFLQSRPLPEMKMLTEDAEDEDAEEVGGSSQHNYLEILLWLLRYPQLTDTTHDMLQLTRLIDQLCEPLEILNETSLAGEVEADEYAADGFVWSRVPAVPLSKASLKSLCDALMSEFCSKEVFDHIISAISRLAYVKENCSILMEVLVEVVLDLSLLSSSRIQTVISHFAHAAKSLPPSSSSPTSRPLVHSIPLGEIGSQDHLRLFRALQTLQTLCKKVGKSLSDLLPSDELQSIWQSMDHLLRLLETYFIPADSFEKFDQKKQLNSALSSVLSKILPLLEGFFLVHTADLLEEAAAKSEPSPPSEGQEMRSHQETLPGAKYRNSEAFKRMNLSLFSDGERDLQHAASLSRLKSFQSSRSMRSNPSFDHTGASAFVSNSFSRPHRLLAFVHSHKNILNLLIRWYPSLLDGSLEAFVRIAQLRSYLSFDSKRLFFSSQIKQRKNSSQTHRSIHLQVHRESIFEESFNQLRFRSADEMRGRLVVTFAEEEGIDAGGLTREWFGILTREIFNPNYCLFTAAADGATFQPNPYSGINTNHLDYFKFVGKVFGKAVVDGHLLDGHFTRSFYKHVLGVPVEYNDIEGLEPEYFKSLKQILEFPLEDLGLELTFSAESQTFGKHQVPVPSSACRPLTEADTSLPA
jgi:hypothetical protein